MDCHESQWLPVEIVCRICAALTDWTDVENMSCVCKSLRHIVMRHVHRHVIRKSVGFTGDFHVQLPLTRYFNWRDRTHDPGRKNTANTIKKCVLKEIFPRMRKYSAMWTLRLLQIPPVYFSRFSNAAHIWEPLATKNVRVELLDVPCSMMCDIDLSRFRQLNCGIRMRYTWLCHDDTDERGEECTDLDMYECTRGTHKDRCMTADALPQRLPSHICELVLSDALWFDGDRDDLEHVRYTHIRNLSSEKFVRAGDDEEFGEWMEVGDVLDEFMDIPSYARGPCIDNIFPNVRVLHNICLEAHYNIALCSNAAAVVIDDPDYVLEHLRADALPSALDMIAFPWMIREPSKHGDPYRKTYVGRNVSVTRVFIVRVYNVNRRLLKSCDKYKSHMVPYVRSMFPAMSELYFGQPSRGDKVYTYTQYGGDGVVRTSAYDYAKARYCVMCTA